MSVVQTAWYRKDGRIRGCFAYMLLCSDGGLVYCKIGISNDPLERLMALRLGCPVTPRQFLYVEQPSRVMALKLERALHRAMGKWRVQGEWFTLSHEERGEFNKAWREVFPAFAKRGWPMKWTRVSVQSYVNQRMQAQAFIQRRWATSGQSFRDFTRHLNEERRLQYSSAKC